MHSFTYSVYISWVLAKVLQCTSPTCPFFFLPTRPLPCPWEDPPINPPSSDPSSPPPLLARPHSDPPASYSADHDTSLHQKVQLSPTACQTQYPQAAGLTLPPLVTDWFPYTFLPYSTATTHIPRCPGLSPSVERDRHFHFAGFIFFNVPFHF